MIEQMGLASWPKRARQFLSELLGSAYVAHLKHELLQVKVERDRVIADLRAENRELLNRLLEAKGVGAIIQPKASSTQPLPATTWQLIQARAIQENAEEEAKQPKEN